MKVARFLLRYLDCLSRAARWAVLVRESRAMLLSSSGAMGVASEMRLWQDIGFCQKQVRLLSAWAAEELSYGLWSTVAGAEGGRS